MRKLTAVAALCLAVLAVASCTSAPTPIAVPQILSQFSDTMEGVCSIWEKVRDKYPQIRESAILLREVGGIDDETWQALVYVDANVPKLDRWLALICAAEAGENNAHEIAREKASVDWNQVGSVVLKVASFAISKGLL